MPYPTPNRTDIVLLHEVPLDSTYRNSIYFSTAGGQATYFLAHKKGALEWTQCSYHRNEDELRVDAPIDQCMDVNYVMYKNDSYGAKWFYAFVTGCRFVNPNCTALKIELDVLQTWYFDYELMPCFIERCHTATDVIGENILPEPVEVGELRVLTETSSKFTVFKRWDIIAYSTFDWSTWSYGQVVGDLNNGNVFSGLHRTKIGQIELSQGRDGAVYSAYTLNPGSTIATLLNQHPDLVDGVVAIVMAPTAFELNDVVHIGITKPSAASSIDGYYPKCKKLFTKQFLKLMVTDGSGSGKYFSFEDFANSTQCDFYMYSDRAPGQSVLCVPDGYNGMSAGSKNFVEAVTMSGFAQCAWVSDTFKTYLAQNQAQIGLTIATGAVQTAVGAGMIIGSGGLGAYAGASMAAGGISSLISTFSALHDQQAQPPKQHGAISNTIMMAVGEKSFNFVTYAPKAEYLKICDDFMNVYGYSVNDIGTVNINTRPHWTYNKTNGAVAKPKTGSGCTAADLAKIQSIFDNGVTFWADGYEVGDYSLDNRV